MKMKKKKKEEEEEEERRIKRRRRRKKKKNKIEIFMLDFLHCEEKSWNSGAIHDIRIAKGFHL